MNLKDSTDFYFKKELQKTILYKAIAEEFDYSKPKYYYLNFTYNDKKSTVFATDTLITIILEHSTYDRAFFYLKDLNNIKEVFETFNSYIQTVADSDIRSYGEKKDKMLLMDYPFKQCCIYNVPDAFIEKVITKYLIPNFKN
jgi:hypothetical protein